MTPRSAFFSQGVEVALLLLGIISVFALIRPAAAAPAYGVWFRYAPEVEENWKFAEVTDDPNQVIITPKYAPPNVGRKRIFVLYPSASYAYDIAISTVLQSFAEKRLNVEFTAFTYGGRSDIGKQALALAEGGYNLILAMGSQSTAWLWQNYKDKRLPVVSICAKDPVVLGQMAGYDKGSATNFAFTSLNTPVQVQMGYLLELKPTLKSIGILVDSRNVSAVETQAKPVADFMRGRGVQVIDVSIDGTSQVREQLVAKIRDAVQSMRKSDPELQNSAFWITGSTSVFNEIGTINLAAERVPVLSVVPEVVKPGDSSAVLSIGVSFESNAFVASTYAEKILTGKAAAGELRVGVISPPDIAVNMRRARDIGLSLPFSWFESAAYVYDYDGRAVRTKGRFAPSDM